MKPSKRSSTPRTGEPARVHVFEPQFHRKRLGVHHVADAAHEIVTPVVARLIRIDEEDVPRAVEAAGESPARSGARAAPTSISVARDQTSQAKASDRCLDRAVGERRRHSNLCDATSARIITPLAP